MTQPRAYDPDGVVPGGWVAAEIVTETKRQTAARRGGLAATSTAIELPKAEAARRADLLARARKGEKRAIQALAEDYHLRLIPVNAVQN